MKELNFCHNKVKLILNTQLLITTMVSKILGQHSHADRGDPAVCARNTAEANGSLGSSRVFRRHVSYLDCRLSQMGCHRPVSVSARRSGYNCGVPSARRLFSQEAACAGYATIATRSSLAVTGSRESRSLQVDQTISLLLPQVSLRTTRLVRSATR